jgi:hypothetical protein
VAAVADRLLSVHDGLDEIARLDAEHAGLAALVLDELSGEDALDVWGQFCVEQQAVAAAEAVVTLARYRQLHPDEEDP